MNKAEQIVDDVLNDLHGRKGIGDELDMIEPRIYDEMRDELIEIVRKHFK